MTPVLWSAPHCFFLFLVTQQYRTCQKKPINVIDISVKRSIRVNKRRINDSCVLKCILLRCLIFFLSPCWLEYTRIYSVLRSKETYKSQKRPINDICVLKCILLLCLMHFLSPCWLEYTRIYSSTRIHSVLRSKETYKSQKETYKYM